MDEQHAKIRKAELNRILGEIAKLIEALADRVDQLRAIQDNSKNLYAEKSPPPPKVDAPK